MLLGVLISRDTYEGIRAAQPSDLSAVLEIIRPLEAEGVLVARSDEQMLREMGHCFLMVRDGAVLACGEHFDLSLMTDHNSFLIIYP